MGTSLADQLREQGYVVLRREIDPVPLTAEIDRVLRDGVRDGDAPTTLAQGSGTVTFQYVPMMCELTPVSLGLLDRFSLIAAELLGRAVLPGRAKGTRYYGDSDWHRDSEHDVPSIAFVTYLEPVHAANGALRVLAGSHADHRAGVPGVGANSGDDGCSDVVDTVPGDVIVFDEHLVHGSSGGVERRQWRVDFVIDPRDDDQRADVRAWFGQSIPDEQDDPGYDTDRYPSYGHHWRRRDRPWTNRLRDLGVYQ